MSDRAKYWAGLLSEWQRSGLSQAEFCRRRGLKAVTLAWWKRRLQDSGVHSSQRRPVARALGQFVEVRLPSLSSAPGYEVVLAGGRSIRVPAQFDPQILSRLITAVESC